MRLPDGRECPYYYANFHRREDGVELCRLLEGTPDEGRWTPDYCRTCPVPEIRRVNTCPKMKLHGHIGRRHFWERSRVLIEAVCSTTGQPVRDPYVGCGQCHPRYTFVVASEAKTQGDTNGASEGA